MYNYYSTSGEVARNNKNQEIIDCNIEEVYTSYQTNHAADRL